MDNLLMSQKCIANEYSEELYDWIKDRVSKLDNRLQLARDNCMTHRDTKIEVIYPDEESREKYAPQVESIFQDALDVFQLS